MAEIKTIGAPNIVAEYRIMLDSNSQVHIHGPIGDMLLFLNVMNLAEQAVLRLHNEKRGEQSQIVVPQMGAPIDIVGKN